MSGINSSLTVAGGVSAQLSQTASGFSSVNQAVSKAERTTVSGNTNAKNSLASIHSRGQRLSNAIARDGNNIHSVAKEFSSIDQKIKQSFDIPFFSPTVGGGGKR
ncbi:TIGR04197 family type VII secretion effector [Enterococcus termitis]|jgi:type VII secretion effector (TIGR04197 family)|uniref:Type VII secretion effector n=1 Tax=Enterococcus termitis TaxID=332950 RepID=A0A1E5GK70_9ENTE|nr:TIGR04197 family type VII secretion effector [Enterococcus termitis]OEG13126.1 type VII secretion effector [Enterococcus termitis]OJG99013.1 type VII secretion effector [Enterococcus termitis]